jgi:phosphoribosylanthranilate isomerase
MRIQRVVLSGVDDQCRYRDMAELSNDFLGFVQFGILVGREQGIPRYPSHNWIRSIPKDMNLSLSLHLCGGWAESFCGRGYLDSIKLIESLEQRFDHVQINCVDSSPRIESLASNVKSMRGQRFIIQSRHRDDAMISVLRNPYVGGIPDHDVSPLYDESRGKGVVGDWKRSSIASDHGVAVGYAGGLTPENLEEELRKISDVAFGHQVWIDAESGLRTKSRFDINKARKFVEIASRFR